MSAEEVNNIIRELESYIGNLKRLSKNQIYIENNDDTYTNAVSGQPEINEHNSEEITVQNEDKSEIPTEVKERSTVEKDLFGNVVNIKEEWEFSENLQDLNSLICNCQKCVLGATRTKFVFGVGNPNADIVIIGEAPGADEDAKGEPFVGRAGQLLNKILEATGFKRDEVFICNILKCRPPGNRNPLPEEVEKCRPYLEKQLSLLKPKLILLLGRVAAESLLKTREPLNKLRGKVHDYKGYKVMITFHPAALLRNPNWKRPTWDDMKQFKSMYEEILKKN
jgi:DNA polymerase